MKKYQFNVLKTVKSETMENAKSMAESFLELRQTSLITSDIIGEETNVKPYVEPIEVDYVGWKTTIRQGQDTFHFDYEIHSLELYVDGELYQLPYVLQRYRDFVDYAKNFVKENPNA